MWHRNWMSQKPNNKKSFLISLKSGWRLNSSHWKFYHISYDGLKQIVLKIVTFYVMFDTPTEIHLHTYLHAVNTCSTKLQLDLPHCSARLYGRLAIAAPATNIATVHFRKRLKRPLLNSNRYFYARRSAAGLVEDYRGFRTALGVSVCINLGYILRFVLYMEAMIGNFSIYRVWYLNCWNKYHFLFL